MTAELVVVRAGLRDRPGLWDLRLCDGVIASVVPHQASSTVPIGKAELLDANGSAVGPGLCDHHVHLLGAAAALDSVACGPPAVSDRQGLRAALAAASPGRDGWVRGTGWDETTAGELDARGLDAMRADVPVRVQHRSGALWVLNSRGIEALGLSGSGHPGVERVDAQPTGRLWRADELVAARPAARPPHLGRLGTLLRTYGVTAVTDATPDSDAAYAALITAAVDGGGLDADVLLMGVSDPGHPRVRLGPRKIVVADSALPDVGTLAAQIAAAHAAGRNAALHCISVEALVLALAAWQETGIRDGDRVEHAANVPDPFVAVLAATGLRVVTQPGFLADRGSLFRREVAPAEHDDLYRVGSLLHAGVQVAFSSDAPYGPLDPWTAIQTASTRIADDGVRLGEDEAISVDQALDRYETPSTDPGGRPRRLIAGTAADLVAFDRPWDEIRRGPAGTRAVARVRAGVLTA